MSGRVDQWVERQPSMAEGVVDAEQGTRKK